MIALKKYKKDILLENPLVTNKVTHRNERWLRQIKHRDAAKLLASFDGKSINRNDVISAYRNYFKGKSSDATTPFLLTMAWGYNTPGYGAFRVNKMIAGRNRNLIVKSMQSIKDRDVRSAFDALMKIDGLGISFVSKVLYFAARGKGLKNYPLIFDTVVANALVYLTSQGALYKMVKSTPSDDFEAYETYNSLVRKWANQLKVPAENMEYFLFIYIRKYVEGKDITY